jgi:hypothetical protein
MRFFTTIRHRVTTRAPGTVGMRIRVSSSTDSESDVNGLTRDLRTPFQVLGRNSLAIQGYSDYTSRGWG